jgi:hypothetical protein
MKNITWDKKNNKNIQYRNCDKCKYFRLYYLLVNESWRDACVIDPDNPKAKKKSSTCFKFDKNPRFN